MDAAPATKPSDFSLRLIALGPVAIAELAAAHARPELAWLEVWRGAAPPPARAGAPVLVTCLFDPSAEHEIPTLEAAVRDGWRDGAAVVVVIVPHGQLSVARRQRLATHLRACVLEAAGGDGAMVGAAIALAAPIAADGNTCFHTEDVATILAAGSTGHVVHQAARPGTEEACAPLGAGNVIAVISGAFEFSFVEIAKIANQLEVRVHEDAGVLLGTPEGLTGEPGEVTIFVVASTRDCES